MRIGQMVTTYQQQANLTQLQLQQQSVKAFSGRTGGAQRANQARLTEASKGFVQATKVRDGVAAVATAVGQASDVVTKAQGTGLSPADRKQLLADFTKAVAAVDQGVKDQNSALADKTLTNTAYQAKTTTVAAADQLGTGVSKQFISLAALKNFDPSTATTEQLGEAAKVLDAAAKQTTASLAAADAQSGRLSGRVNTLQSVQDSLAGNPPVSARQRLVTDALQGLSQPNTGFPPGSIFNSLG